MGESTGLRIIQCFSGSDYPSYVLAGTYEFRIPELSTISVILFSSVGRLLFN